MKIIAKSILVLCVLFTYACKSDDKDNGPSASAQLDKEVKVIDAQLAADGITPIKDVSGIRMDLHELGTGGLPPKATSKIKAKYTGKFLNGTTFEEGTLDQSVLEGLISGWQIGLMLMPVGTKATLYIPSLWAYGPNGSGKIPGNTTLVFDLELLDVYVTQTEKDQLKADTLAIDDYIGDQGIQNVIKDSTGLRYVITQEGKGQNPSWYDKVKLNYSGKLLTNGVLDANAYTSGSLEPSATSDSRVINFLMDGWKIGLQKMKPGGKATLYIPSGLAYGATSVQVTGGRIIPANTLLVFEIELVDIIK